LVIVMEMARMMPRLEAEEQLARTAAAGVAKQLEPGDWASRQMNAWRRMADVYVTRGTPPPADLGAVGIGFKKVVRHG
jgi:hypothetical protein